MKVDDPVLNRLDKAIHQCERLKGHFSRYLSYLIEREKRYENTIAEAAECHPSDLSRFKKGLRLPSPYVLLRLGDALRLDTLGFSLLVNGYIISITAGLYDELLKAHRKCYIKLGTVEETQEFIANAEKWLGSEGRASFNEHGEMAEKYLKRKKKKAK